MYKLNLKDAFKKKATLIYEINNQMTNTEWRENMQPNFNIQS